MYAYLWKLLFMETLICLNLCSSPNPRCDEMEKVPVTKTKTKIKTKTKTF